MRNVAVAKIHAEATETARQGSAFWTHWLGEFGFFEALRMKDQEGPVPKTFGGAACKSLALPTRSVKKSSALKPHLMSIQLLGEKVIPHFAKTNVPETKMAAVGG
jgi:hypothetical protein